MANDVNLPNPTAKPRPSWTRERFLCLARFLPGLCRLVNRRQIADLLCNFATGADQIGDEPIVHIEDAFVLGPIAHIVALREDAPYLGPRPSVSGST